MEEGRHLIEEEHRLFALEYSMEYSVVVVSPRTFE